MTTIRSATAADVPWIAEELRAFAAFFGTRLSLFPADEAQAQATVRALVERCVFFVALASDRPVGFIAGTVGPHPFNANITVLTELLWWVTPAARGSSAGARLLDTFTAFGRQHADWVVMSLETQSPVHDAALERRGFRLHERSFLMETGR